MIRSSSFYSVVELVIIIMAKFACCIDNVLAAKILAAINLVIAVLTFVHKVIEMVREKELAESNDFFDKWQRFFLLLWAVMGIIDDIILMVGSFKKSRCVLIVWMIIAAILTIILGGQFVWNFSAETRYSPEDYVIQLAIFGFNVWTLFVVSGAIKEIREGA